MFDVVVDAQILGVRERAKCGNFDSMVALGGYIQQGKYTRRNENLALEIFDHVLTRKTEIPFPETVWDAICWKSHLVGNAARKELFIELIRHMVNFPPEEWDFEQLVGAIYWLENQPNEDS